MPSPIDPAILEKPAVREAIAQMVRAIRASLPPGASFAERERIAMATALELVRLALEKDPRQPGR